MMVDIVNLGLVPTDPWLLSNRIGLGQSFAA